MGTLPNEEVTCPLQRLNAGEERGLDRLMECNSTPPGERTPTILLSQTTSAFINPWFKKGMLDVQYVEFKDMSGRYPIRGLAGNDPDLLLRAIKASECPSLPKDASQRHYFCKRENDQQFNCSCDFHGHIQCGGSPCAADRVLATRFGHVAAELLAEGEFNRLVAVQHGQISSVPITEVADRQRLVAADDELVRIARSVGTCFGD